MNIRAKIFGGGAEEPILKAKTPKGARPDALDSVAVARESRQRSDSRGEDRHRLIGERARITHDGKTDEVQLINLSGGGAMIEGRLPVMLWDRVHLHLGEHGDIECAVRWIRDRRIGLEFAHETRLDCGADEVATLLREVINRSFPDAEFPEAEDQPAEPCAGEPPAPEAHQPPRGDEHRSAPRHPLIWTGTLYHDFQTTPVRVRNISRTGAMIESSEPVRVGAQPLLELSDAVSISGTVQWAVGDQVGLRFNEPFDMSLLAESTPVVAEPVWTPPPYLEKAGAELDADEGHWNHLTLTELRRELEGFLKR